ncbi:hypothetical protein C8R46DRAFT_1350627 [Mycena filopes]|nr:hypothetical protein C8R46DRAFT_1350627 [Mycena filopes]
MSNDALRVRFAELSCAVSQQQRILDGMLARLEIIRGQLDTIVYPVLTLPPEITTEIFMRCLPAECELDPGGDFVDTSHAPLLLTQICGAWRRIALSTSALWASFYLDADCRGLVHLAELADAWFSRARNALSVKVHGSLLTSQWTYNLPGVVEVLQKHSPRMHSLELHADIEDLTWMDSHIFDFAVLRKLRIGLMGDEAIVEAGASIHVFDHIPLLTEVLLHEIPFSFLPGLPWQQLSKFTGEIYPMAACLAVLRLMPNLAECAFAVFEDFANSEVFTHPSLQHLTLFKSTSNLDRIASSARILLFLSLPALHTLQVQVWVSAATLDSFFQRRPPLVKLSLSPHPMYGVPPPTLHCLPSFTALPLAKLNIWYPDLQSLAPFLDVFGRNASFLPQLQILSVDYLHTRPITDHPVHQAGLALTNRMNLVGCARLQSFRIGVSPHVDMVAEEDISTIRHLRASGLAIHIGTETNSVI